MSGSWQRKRVGQDWAPLGVSGPTLADFPVIEADIGARVRYALRTGVANRYFQAETPIEFSSAITDPPIITFQPEDAKVVVGEEWFFVAGATGDNLTWLWQSSTDGITWTNIPGATGEGPSAFVIFTTTLEDNGRQYRAIFSNGGGSRTSSAGTLAVAVSPIEGNVTVNGLSSPQAIDAGQQAVFAFVFTGAGSNDFDYQWQREIDSEWIDINGATSQTLTLQSVLTEDAGSYRVIVSFDGGLETNFTASITVTPAAGLPTITLQPQDVTIDEGESATFTATATGGDGLGYAAQRSFDGTTWETLFTDQGGNATYEITNAPLSLDGTRYRFLFTNNAGSVSTTSALLTVEAPVALGDVRFGVLTPAGQGTQDIDATNGTYSVGGGSFSVSNGRIDVVTMPAVGTYDVDGTSVEVVANARTCSRVSEIAAMWTSPLGTHPAGTKILLAPGTYNIFASVSGNNRLMNDWVWESLDTTDPARRATIRASEFSQASYFPSTGSAGFTFRYVNFFQPQDPVGIPWNIVARVPLTIGNNVQNVLLEHCRFYGDIIPVTQGGKLTSKSMGVSTSIGSSVTIRNCEFDGLCTGVRLSGHVIMEDCFIHNIYSDYIEGRTGLTGEIRNNHCTDRIGDGSFLHGDHFQLQVPPNTPVTGPLLFEGNTFSMGNAWELSAGTAHETKPNPTLSTPGPHLLNIPVHHAARSINCRVADAGGTMTLILPKASEIGPDATFVPYQLGSGVVTIEKDPGDTTDDDLVMTSNNQSRSFVSDGVSHWRRVAPGYRGGTQQRSQDKTLGPLEKGVGVWADASAGPLLFTLPGGTEAFSTSVKKDDTSANHVFVGVPDGQTFTVHGVPGITTQRPLIRCGDVLEFIRAEGSTVWVVNEKNMGGQGFFSNGPSDGFENLTVRYNILVINSPRGFSLGDVPYANCQFHNNTILRMSPPDSNGDGVIGAADSWNNYVVGTLWIQSGVDTFRNATVGSTNLRSGFLRHLENVGMSWQDPTNLSAVTPFLALTTPEETRPTTREEIIQAAIAKPDGGLVIDVESYSYIGAVGTTAENGPYNWVTGQVNANSRAPSITSSLPAVGTQGVFADSTITLNFNELVSLGTGTISLRVVGGSEIESFNVETTDRIVVTDTSIVITPTNPLPLDTEICLRIGSQAIQGYFNPFPGISDDSFNFRTFATVPTPLVIDEFNASVLTNLASHTPDLGGPWSPMVNGGVAEVHPEGYMKFATNTGGGLWDIWSIESGESDVRVATQVTGSNNNRIALMFRGINSSNYWRFQTRFGDATEGSSLVKVVNGVTTTVLTINGNDADGDPNQFVATAPNDLLILCDGPDIEVWFNNKLKMAVTDSALQTATKVGLGVRSTVPRFNFFTAKTLGGT
jgi:hypothetical protein